MLIVPLEEAREGMRLALPIVHPENPEQELLRPGFTLTDTVLGRLRDLDIGLIYVDYPDLGDLDRHLAAFLSPARQEVYRQIRDTITSVQQSVRPTVSFPDYYCATRDLVITLMQQGQHAAYLDQMTGKLGSSAVAHATAVAHLSLVLGLKLETYLIQQRSRLAPKHAREVVNLGVAGMLHDVGLANLPAPLRRFSRIDPPQDEAQVREWRTHVQVGYDMVRGGIEASAAAAVLHHHQHFDGSGFPSLPASPGEEPRNAGTRIHIFARILAAADLYDRLTAGPDGRRRPNIEILHLMRTTYAGWIDPTVLAMMPSAIPPFPPGMKITLSDGTPAMTFSFRSDMPYRPVVKRLIDPQRLILAPEAIDLAKQKDLAIATIGGVDARPLIPKEEKKGRAA